MSASTPPPPASAFNIGATIEKARAAWAAGRADEAEIACRQVLAVWPGQMDATYLLGLMAYRFGNLDLAVAHVREACRSPRELRGKVGDGVNQAADLISATASIPSLNFIPLTIFGNWF
jgi:hypothetical protein